MYYIIFKALISGAIIAAVSEIAKRSPGLGALVASLPLISILGVIWLWHDTGDTVKAAGHLQSTFWLVLPSLPMFLIIPALLRAGIGFWPSLTMGCLATITFYLITIWLMPKIGVTL